MLGPFAQFRFWIPFLVVSFAALPAVAAHPAAVQTEEYLDAPGQAINERDPYGTDDRGGRKIANLPVGFDKCELISGGSARSNLRTELGLSAMVNEQNASVARMGIRVTPDDALFLDAGLQIRDSIDSKKLSDGLVAAVGTDFLGLRWNASEQRIEVSVSADVADERVAKAIDAIVSAPYRDSVTAVGVEIDGRRATPKELSALSEAWYEMHPNKVFKLEFDPTCGKSVALISDAGLAKEMNTLLADRLSHDFAVSVDASLKFESISRNDLHNPHTGGLTLAVFQSGSGVLCTSSISFRNLSNSLEYAITAAHCLDNHPYNGSTVSYAGSTDWYQHASTFNSATEISHWGFSYYRYGGNADVAWTRKKASIPGQPTTMTHGGNHTMQGMGWWQWHPSLAIHGDPVCHSGRNWAGAVCGTIVNTNYVGSHLGASWAGMMDSTMIGYEGDSGGTVWSPRSDGVWYAGLTSTTYVHTNSWGTKTNRMLFTHIGNVDGLHSYLDAPVGMS